MRYAIASLFALLSLGTAGCGGDAQGNGKAFYGSYSVGITANGKMDTDEMTVSAASNDGVLLTFVYGISEVRCALPGGDALSIPRQVLHVDHSTGVLDGYATGMGTISTDGMVNIQIDLQSPGLSLGDGGAANSGDGGATVTYTITGMKTM